MIPDASCGVYRLDASVCLQFRSSLLVSSSCVHHVSLLTLVEASTKHDRYAFMTKCFDTAV